ncbi:Lipoxygenase plant protein [Dioscorea alata]|uniref:Lipoxygenase plant protein n=1 Tax=Dioscorea alata TaxID=55571 RepID=A0ACB7U7A5_DIOAL|nr:Lipoxygenase plant protein [Dioscorea alata]
MTTTKELLSSSFLQRSFAIPSTSSVLLNRSDHNKLCFSPSFAPLTQRSSSFKVKKLVRHPVKAVISEKMVVSPVAAVEPPVKFKVRASVTVKRKMKKDLKESIFNHFDAFTDKIGRNIALELVSNELEPRTKKPKISNKAVLKDWFEKKNVKADRVVYTAEFIVDSSFGTPGAILITNKHQMEFYLDSIVIEGFASGPVHFPCNSWVQSTKDHPNKRVFFSNKPYLPFETPPGLKALRDLELRELRGDGTGERKLTDRVYDYATYNDLGNPDKGVDYVRPILGGDAMPYPRRCRTGRPPSDSDMRAESRVEDPLPVYVPRDEAFEEEKQEMLIAGAKKALLHIIVPSLVASFAPESRDFKGFHDIDNLFKEGLRLQQSLQDHLFKKLPLVGQLPQSGQAMLLYDTPDILSKDKFAWLRDDEFARQALAGINPVNIECLKVFPPVSKLDPAIYGPPESAIKEEHIIGHLHGMSVQQALEEKKLFMLDFHDTYLPFIDRINTQDGRKAYATRTIFYQTPLGTLKPIAIELSLPPATHNCKRAKRVFTPPIDATTTWLWQLAKAHVCSNDAGVHQLVNHWLRTHACVEPFILGAHRQLSVMHPIFKLLKPHMRYTLEINAMARQILINAGGVIESGFTPGSCCMEISAAFYRDHWRFDQEALPADLIRRGMAVEDPSQPHGLKLLVKDYPYANDGLLLWTAIQKWVQSYVDRYYPNQAAVQTDTELQSWYAESVHVGHADKRHASWWPKLTSPDELASFLTTLIWLVSAQHAALNFGQYPLGGYIPNRPPLVRRLVPVEGDPEFDHFRSEPHRFFLSAMPSLTQATQFMTVIDTLSTHSTDEEYIGERRHPYTWTGDEEIVERFHEFATEIKRIEREIDRRNSDPTLRNRCGAGVLPYELMAPSSGPGITCKGVPNSVSI